VWGDAPGGRGLRVPFYDLIKVILEAVSDGDDLLSDIDLVAGDGVDMGKAHDKRAVYANKFFRRELVGEGFQVIQCQDGFGAAPDMDLGIVFHAFAEEDIFELYFDDLIFRLDKDKAVVPVMDIDRGGEIVPDLVHRGKEAFEGKRSVQIAEDIHFGLFFFLFLFVCYADDDGIITGFFQTDHDLIVQEADIPEDEVCAVCRDELIKVGG
jgi:hypothetical protein